MHPTVPKVPLGKRGDSHGASFGVQCQRVSLRRTYTKTLECIEMPLGSAAGALAIRPGLGAGRERLGGGDLGSSGSV